MITEPITHTLPPNFDKRNAQTKRGAYDKAKRTAPIGRRQTDAVKVASPIPAISVAASWVTVGNLAWRMTYKAVAIVFLSIAFGEPAEAGANPAVGIGRNPSGRWIAVSETRDVTIYMYPSTIHGQGKLAHMWSLVNYKSPQKNLASSLPVMSEKSEIEYDCEKVRWRTLSSAFHTHSMGNGQTVFSKSESTQWQPVMPNFDSEILWKVACKKIAPKGKVQ